MGEKRSDISGFNKLSVDERIEKIREFADLNEEEINLLKKTGSLDIESADRMIENVVSTTELPFGIATNFVINGKDYVIPMCIEEPSVVAAASYAAKLARPSGGFTTDSDEPIMIGQIQMVGIENVEKGKEAILKEKDDIIKYANDVDPAVLVKYGGGLRDIEVRILESQRGKMLIVHLLVDCRDAMGANAVNTLAEAIGPRLEKLVGGKVRLRIISNLAVHRKARSRAVWSKEDLEKSTKGEMSGEEVVEAVLDAYAFADADPYRCTTNNKGMMNGIDAVVIATGNDFRAIESGAHSFAAIDGRYKPLAKYSKNENGDLVGEIELPMAIGLVGGTTRTHPIAKIAVKILGVKSANELGEVIASVGLAQNFAALRALATEGIQKGHMRLHAKNIAVLAGAKGEQIDKVAAKMIEEKKIRVDRGKEILESLESD
ncbi:MAG: hydroxymethylglutaryl-CoA reductase, degradative [Nanoarchaeota archaeon]|nr:hydroxymethylglutaryl-CoA reductase, degradative [Nanoarchaeota archaeon]MBU1135657.1 hydroxymethylglutaryl-CoA reductase, degradative [Nanoarchaeota archaeon]MBU2520022.1 hydroxymethylglutaryl-CoA reductase, degradative [Nanoarchaeota archaeon]